MTTESTPTVSPAKLAPASTLAGSVLSENLARALALTAPAIDKRTAWPMLRSSVLSSDRGRLTVSAFNFDMAIRSSIGAQITGEGIAIVDHASLTAIAKGPNAVVAIEPGVDAIAVSRLRASTDLRLADPDAYPAIPTFDPIVSFEATAAEWARCMAFVLPAVARDDSRPVLTAVHVHGKVGDSSVNLVAANGFRLHKITLPLTAPLTDDIYMLIPFPVIKATISAIKVLKRSAAFVGVRANHATVGISIANSYGTSEAFELTASLIVGQFPNYGQLIPNATDPAMRIVEFDPAELLAVTAGMVKICEAGILRMRESASDPAGEWRIEARSDDSPPVTSSATIEARTVRHASSIEGVSQERFAVNVTYLREALAVMPKCDATIAIQSPSQQCAIRSAADDSLVAVIMPMFVQW